MFEQLSATGGSPSGIRDPGAVVGSYRLIDLIGQGGMGVVYLAEHTRLGRRVAIKMLRSEYSTNRQAVRRFFTEARAVNRISHKHIVEITDFIEEPGADNYYVMELLIGHNLATLVDGCPQMALERSSAIMIQVAHALEAVHSAGIVHRDLKPDNVFLIDRAGTPDFVKVLDFGVAKLGDLEEQIDTHRTAAGTILGTPEYMSPEQASGTAIDPRTDIYAFGVMLYELVTGRLPLTGKSFGELVVKHLTVTPEPPSQIVGLPHAIPDALDDLILACLAKLPDERPATMAIVRERLDAIALAEGWVPPVEDLDLAASPAASMPKLRRPTEPVHDAAVARSPSTLVESPRRGRLAPVLIAIASTAAVALIATLVLRRGEVPRATPPASPVAAQVDIELVTTPPGAAVYLDGRSEPLGTTPFVASLARSDRDATFELRLAGHETRFQHARLDRATRIVTELTALPDSVVAARPAIPAIRAAGSELLPVAVDRTPSRPAGGKRREPDRASKPLAGANPVGPTTKAIETTTPIETAPPPGQPPSPAVPGDRTGVLNPFQP